MPTLLLDGKYIRGFYVGMPRIEYPFQKYRDTQSIEVYRVFKISLRNYVPGRVGVDKDPVYRDAYLTLEGNPEPTGIGDVVTVARVFSRVPQQQTVYSSRYIIKPSLPGEFPQVSGNSLIIQPEANVPRWVFYTQHDVTDSGVPGSGAYPTGGTFTLSCGGQTTSSLAYNASASAVQSALNALSYITARGGVTVTGSYTAGFVIKWNGYPVGSVDASSLTGTVGYVTASSAISTANKTGINVYISPIGGASFNGGTFTLTVLGQTTAAIAYNASLATVQSALEALSNIGTGGIYSIGNPGAGSGFTGSTILNSAGSLIGILFEITQASITVNGASLTPSGSAAAITLGNPDGNQTGREVNLNFTGVALATRTLAAADSLGISTSDSIVVTQGTNYRVLAAGTFSVTDKTITLTSASGEAFTDGTTITAVGKQNGSTYTGGGKLTRIKTITDFYLPGVTPGITTPDDIPLPDYEGDDASMLAAIFNGSTEINYEVGALAHYKDGPILMRERTTLNASTL